MKTPNTHTQTAFRLLVAPTLAATLLAVTPSATAEEPKKATTRTEEKDVKDDIHERQDSEQRITKEKHKPSTNNVRAQSAKAKAVKTHIQTLHHQLSDIYRTSHDYIHANTHPPNQHNQH